MPISPTMETLVSGMIANQERHEVIANNIANVNAVGFKKDIPVNTTFSRMLDAAESKPIKKKNLTDQVFRTNFGVDTQAYTHEVRTAHGQGDPRITDNTFDVALLGKGFFTVQTPQGARYTRNGGFMLNGQNQLVTAKGDRGLIESTKTMEGVALIIDGDTVTFQTDGSVQVDGITVGKLNIVDFTDYSKLHKMGNALFTYAGDAQNITSAADVQLKQGYLESSNVNALTEMTGLLFNSRHYELSGKSIKAVENTLNRAIVDLGRFK